jgi:hypothetical protein
VPEPRRLRDALQDAICTDDVAAARLLIEAGVAEGESFIQS